MFPYTDNLPSTVEKTNGDAKTVISYEVQDEKVIKVGNSLFPQQNDTSYNLSEQKCGKLNLITYWGIFRLPNNVCPC